MSMYKKATFSHKCKITALNKPKGEGWDIYNLPNQIKTASTTVEGEDLAGFDLKQATKEHPDHLYIKVFAIKKDEPNDNGDAFSERELKTAAKTFVGVPLFTNHQNDDVEKARGECVHSWYDQKEGGIFIIGRVDKIAYPRLARGIEEGYITGCFPPDAPVLMADGTEKNICDIEDGDYVISGKGNIKKVLGIRERGYNYPLVSIQLEGNKQPLVCTAHHNIMVYRLPELCACGCEEELAIKKDKRITSKTFNRKFKTGHNLRGESEEFNHEYIQKIKACELQDGDFLIEPKYIDDSCDDFVTEEEAFLIGLFLAEGSYEKRQGERHSVIFSFSHKELETLACQCEEKLKISFSSHRNGPTVNYYPNASQSRVSLYGKDIAEWFYDKCGEYSDGKILNPKLMKLGKSKTASLIAGFMEGDGYKVKEKYYGFGIVSQDLTSQLRLLLEKIGVRTNYKIISEANGRWGYKPVHEVTFGKTTIPDILRDKLIYKKAEKSQVEPASWHNIENNTLRRIKSIEEIDYDGTVYDIEVEDDHTYCVNHIAVSNTSMGCSVESSICSVCHNKSHTAEDYCSHVSNRKNRKYTGEIKCSYHNSPVDTDEECPICGSTKNNIETIKHADQQIFEHNFGLKFIENSFVVNPACHDCGVRCVLNSPKVENKITAFNKTVGNLIKEAHLNEEDNGFVAKFGGIKELQSLKNSMQELEEVTKSMLKQKESVSMEYVSQIVKAMADIQDFYDELVEMGYGALPSPSLGADGGVTSAVSDQFSEGVPSEQMATQQPQQPQQPTPKSTTSPSGSQTSDLGGLGNVTMPKNSSKKIEDFLKISRNLINKVSSLDESIYNLNKNIKNQLEIGVDMATENKTTKVAASADNHEMITEKQLSKEEETLHPRTSETYEGITESNQQIGGEEKSNDTTSDSPQVRKGTYETTTEDQLKTQSALGDAVIHYNDCPEVITEKQWTDFSKDVAGNLPEDYTESITQAQIRDLLSNHKFIGDVETITEDQLRNISMTEGLKRWANKDYSVSLVKTATNVIADMISTYSKSPSEIEHTLRYLDDNQEDKTKVAFLSVLNSLPNKKEERQLLAQNASYFSKTSSKKTISHMDSLILSMASNAQFGQKSEDLIDTVAHVINNSKQMDKVSSIIKNRMDKVANIKSISKESSLESAIKELDKPEDGKYQIRATMEDIGVPITQKVAFVNGIKKYAQEMIDDDSVAAAVIKVQVGDQGELIIDIQDGAEEEIVPDDIGDIIEGPIEDIEADMNGEECPFDENEIPEEEEEAVEDEEIEGTEEEDKDMKYMKDKKTDEETKDMTGNFKNPTSMATASNKKEIKTAQMMGGEMGGQGGVSQEPGAGATLPGTPGVGAPPMESFTEEPGFEEGEGDELTDELEPLPPGSICPVCGSDDVDVLDGKGKCGNCSSEMNYKVEVNVTKWQGFTPDEDEDGEDEVEEGFEGEGYEMPTEEEVPGEAPGGMEEEMGEIPAAASISNDRELKFAATVKLKPEAVKKVAENKLTVGSYSPATGKPNTVNLGDGNRMCLDTGTKYKVAFMTSKDGKQVYGQWEWLPKTASTVCPSCDRAKQRFVKALSSIKMTEADFDKMDLKDQVNTIVKLKQAGALKTIKTASKQGSIIDDYKLAYGGYGDKFPIESCIEKLARRFGKNALCLSGPDEGKPLAESVCNRLKKADVYTSKIAIKVAGAWSDCDGDEECITHQVRSGFSLRQAAEVCSTLKIAVGEGEDFFTDELAGDDTYDNVPDADPDVPVFEEEEVDPFEENGMGEDVEGGTVTLELPMEMVEELDAKLDTALGENPEEEEHHEDLDMDGTPDILEDDLGEQPLGSEEVVEESIAPEDLKDCGGGGMKSMEVGFEEEQGNGTDIVEKEEGIPGQNSKLIINDHTNNTEAFVMERNVGKVGKTQMDLSSVIDALNKTAGEKEISQQKAQDTSEIGTYSAGEGGSQMGHENETIRTPQKPAVPRDGATMGQEPTDLNPQDDPQPVVPSDNATMGHEDEVGLSGGENTYTGGDKGQGKTELASADDDLRHMRGFGSSKSGISSLADRIAKKLAPKEPVAKDPDIQPISDSGTIGNEEKFTADDPDNVEGSATESVIGHEKETVEKAPKSPADHPDVFTGNAQQGKEELDSEKTNKDKGTVIGSTDSESEAIRVAGRMLQANQIKPADLPTKISELKAYKPAQIKDIEKAIFAQKGLDTVSDGMSQSVQINEASSVRNSQDDITTKLSSLFTLGKQNTDADNDEMAQLRRTYKK